MLMTQTLTLVDHLWQREVSIWPLFHAKMHDPFTYNAEDRDPTVKIPKNIGICHVSMY